MIPTPQHPLTRRASVLATAALLGLALAAPVHASLIGDTVDASMVSTSGHFISPGSALVVDPGVEFTIGDSSGAELSVDVFDDYIHVESVDPQIFGSTNTFTISDLDWVGQIGFIVGATIENVDNIFIGTPSLLSFTPHSVTVGLSGVAFQVVGASFDVVLETQHVPVPAPLALMVAGLAGIATVRRRRSDA